MFQSSVSHDLSEITLMYSFAAQENISYISVKSSLVLSQSYCCSLPSVHIYDLLNVCFEINGVHAQQNSIFHIHKVRVFNVLDNFYHMLM